MAINNSTAVVVAEDVRSMRGVYEDNRANSELFKTFDSSIQKGDLVVVTTNSRHGFAVIKITEADAAFDIESAEEARWIVAKIDTEQEAVEVTEDEPNRTR